MTEGRIIFAAFTLIAPVVIFLNYREGRRQGTLRQTEDGSFTWEDWRGRECRSDQDPRKPGGAWFEERD